MFFTSALPVMHSLRHRECKGRQGRLGVFVLTVPPPEESRKGFRELELHQEEEEEFGPSRTQRPRLCKGVVVEGQTKD